MAVLLDTNILLRSTQPHHPQYAPATSAVAALLRDGETRMVAVQNLVEFWAVATRAEKDNGLGLTFEEVRREIAVVKRLFRVVPESTQILPEWERLVSTYRVSGKNAHDARLVAVMNVNAIDKILTFNTGDFIRFREIQVLDPHSLR
jgi:predicted nucleic acid-binding protein